MKAPSFWYKTKPDLVAKFLIPTAALYQTASRLRRCFARPYKASVPVICVGNVVAGGAGKTPVALALAEFLQTRGKQPVFVTRGYGGSEAGPLLVTPHHTAQQVGDEALLLAKRAPVWIGRNRPMAVKAAEIKASHIILDDGLQNPTLEPAISFLVIDIGMGLGNGCTLPAGPMREPLETALARTTAVIVIGGTIPVFLNGVRQPVLQARLEPNLPATFPRHQRFIAFAGIGRPEKFFASCRQTGLSLVAEKAFADHHSFTARELGQLRQLAENERAQLLTTEKDWVRLPTDMQAIIYTLPVRLVFTDPAQLAALLPW